MNARTIFLICLTCVLYSCNTDLSSSGIASDIPSENTYPNVDAALWSYFAAFEYEAALRNIRVDLAQERIQGSIENITESNVVGQCSYGGYARSHVVIDQNFWSRTNDLSREMIVFHELGHCFLYRDHTEGRFTDGTCLSIMRSGLQACRDNYRSSTRDFYLDELFSINNR